MIQKRDVPVVKIAPEDRYIRVKRTTWDSKVAECENKQKIIDMLNTRIELLEHKLSQIVAGSARAALAQRKGETVVANDE